MTDEIDSIFLTICIYNLGEEDTTHHTGPHGGGTLGKTEQLVVVRSRLCNINTKRYLFPLGRYH